MRWLYTANCRYGHYSYIVFGDSTTTEYVTDTEYREMMEEDENATDTTS